MMKRAFAAARTLSVDAIGLAGLGGVIYGSWLVYQPAGYIVGGLVLAGIAVLVERRAT